jgi:hypothetical protein
MMVTQVSLNPSAPIPMFFQGCAIFAGKAHGTLALLYLMPT